MGESVHLPAFAEALVFLVAAVVAVPLFQRAGLGSVLGYLAAGLAIGPWGLGLFGEAERVMEIAELGVVLLLFIIGLELKPSRLVAMAREIFGVGSLQMVVCGLAITLYPLLVAGRPFEASLIAGFGLALSSTAIVVQILEERGELRLPHGQTTFAILLMQDLTIVPLLALIAILSPTAGEGGVPAWLQGAMIVGAILGVVVAGRFLLNPLFKIIARWGGREIMTAAALMIVIGAATVMVIAGLSTAMGAFLAGVLLAESRYRHELEADIEPFRGLLLGLFFISVGMSVDLGLIAANWAALLAAVAVLLVVKTGALYAVLRVCRYGHDAAIRVAMLIAQGGEFGFVLFSTAVAAQVMTADHASLLVAIVVLSMAATPLMVAATPWLVSRRAAQAPAEDFADARGTVLIIGFGRFGQVVSQLLLARGCEVTIIDNDVEMIESAARFGFKVYYGDGRRLDVLRAAGSGRAEIVLVCVNGAETTTRIVELLKSDLPTTPVFARSFDRGNTLELLALGVDFEMRETYESAIAFGRQALIRLGGSDEEVAEIEDDVRARDRERLAAQQAGGIYAGKERLRVTPEPLIPPRRTAERLDAARPASADPDKSASR